MNRHFSKEDTKMVNKHIKGCSTWLVTMEIQIKTTMRNHFTPTRTAEIKMMDVTSVGDDVEKLELSHIADRNAKLSQLL